jgi:hypothetical protein
MNNKFVIGWFFEIAAGPTVTPPAGDGAGHMEETAMFIFNRPFQAVAAGFGVALLVLCFDRSCHPPEASPARPPVGNGQAMLVPVTPLRLSSAPVRDLSLSCRLPPA